MRIGPGEMEKIIDEGLSRKGRHPLEEYILLLELLDRMFPQEKSRKISRFGNQKPN